MSLFDSGICNMPGLGYYTYREKIPEKERCTLCDGMGIVRWKYSTDGEGDWRKCFTCGGSGREPKASE
jgi:hypothetical protein